MSPLATKGEEWNGADAVDFNCLSDSVLYRGGSKSDRGQIKS